MVTPERFKMDTFCKVIACKILNFFDNKGTAKPLFPGSSPGAASNDIEEFTYFFMKVALFF